MSQPPFEDVGTALVFRLHAVEREALEVLLADLERTLVAEDGRDPALARLLPDPSPTVPERSEELGRLIRAGLLDGRLERVRALRALLQRARPDGETLAIDLVEEEPWMLLGILNDLRLTIGARIGIEELDRASAGGDGELRQALATLDHFGWWQWHLVAVLDPAAASAEHGAGADREAARAPDGDADPSG